jgi:hypothetical protein
MTVKEELVGGESERVMGVRHDGSILYACMKTEH